MCDTVEKNINLVLPKYFARKKENEVAAEYEYKGKQMLIKGKVVSVKKHEYGFNDYKYAAIAEINISHDPDYDSEKMEKHHLVYCLFDEEHLPSAAKLRSDTKAAIYSTFVTDRHIVEYGFMRNNVKDDIIVDNCVVVQSDASDEFIKPEFRSVFDKEDPIKVYQKIRDLYKNNEIAGEFATGYKVYATGVVSRVYKTQEYSKKETLVIYIDTSENPDIDGHEMDDNFGHAFCEFDIADLKDVIKVVRGDKVTITGYVDGEKAIERGTSAMYIKDCRLTSLKRMCEVL